MVGWLGGLDYQLSTINYQLSTYWLGSCPNIRPFDHSIIRLFEHFPLRLSTCGHGRGNRAPCASWATRASAPPLGVHEYAFGSQSCANRLLFVGCARLRLGTRASPSAIPSLRSALTAFGGYPTVSAHGACGSLARRTFVLGAARLIFFLAVCRVAAFAATLRVALDGVRLGTGVPPV